MPYYVHKYAVELRYGGSEEGGWWYESGFPVQSNVYKGHDEEDAYAKCRELNRFEHERAEREEDYDYTSVLSYRSNHYSYRVEESPVAGAYPEEIPYYE